MLWLGYGVGKGPGNGWLHAKLVLVVVAIGYHHACRSLLRKFEEFANTRSERWFRVFNEIAVLLFWRSSCWWWSSRSDRCRWRGLARRPPLKDAPPPQLRRTAGVAVRRR